jgi:hypothetical protein
VDEGLWNRTGSAAPEVAADVFARALRRQPKHPTPHRVHPYEHKPSDRVASVALLNKLITTSNSSK